MRPPENRPPAEPLHNGGDVDSLGGPVNANSNMAGQNSGDITSLEAQAESNRNKALMNEAKAGTDAAMAGQTSTSPAPESLGGQVRSNSAMAGGNTGNVNDLGDAVGSLGKQAEVAFNANKAKQNAEPASQNAEPASLNAKMARQNGGNDKALGAQVNTDSNMAGQNSGDVKSLEAQAESMNSSMALMKQAKDGNNAGAGAASPLSTSVAASATPSATAGGQPAPVAHGAEQVLSRTRRAERYLFVNSKKSWPEALDHCAGLDRVLATPRYDGDNADLTWYAGTVNIWIGITDDDDEGRWVSGDGVHITWENWKSAEPNGEHSENCVQLYSGDGKWNDKACSTKMPFFCESYGTLSGSGVFLRHAPVRAHGCASCSLPQCPQRARLASFAKSFGNLPKPVIVCR